MVENGIKNYFDGYAAGKKGKNKTLKYNITQESCYSNCHFIF